MRPRELLILIVLAVAAAVVWFAATGLRVREELRAKTTVTRMKMLMGVLQSDQPQSLDEATIRALLERNNRAECLTDAWGRLLLIEMNDPQGTGANYTIVSLGRDGHRGACCIKWTSDWDADAVLQGEQWLQVWYPKGTAQSSRR